MSKPFYSFGIIFKNEIRCLERCLKSLQPLRDAVPCEVVMADTGSDDGSREIAERYADVLFDFPWCDDFSAARNAVMDCCSGEWYFYIDADEWLDDISELITFSKVKELPVDFAGVLIRNYHSEGLEKDQNYMDFTGLRLARLSTGARFRGCVHEAFAAPDGGALKMANLRETVLHHDGYVYADKAAEKAKHDRNMILLKKKLAEDPDDIKTLIECVDCSKTYDAESADYARRAVELVERRARGWDKYGGIVLRNAVSVAKLHDLPEIEDWIRTGWKQFPNSMFTQVDLTYYALAHFFDQENYGEAICWGERYFQGLEALRAKRFDPNEYMWGWLEFESPFWERKAAILLIRCYVENMEPEKALDAFRRIKGCELEPEKQVGLCVELLLQLHRSTRLDASAAMVSFWEQINQPVPNEEAAQMRRREFVRTGANVFAPGYRENEATRDDYLRHGHGVFSKLAGVCGLGTAAAILEMQDPHMIKQALAGIEDWSELPIAALVHALERGVEFPIAGKPLNIEEMDGLASRLAHDRDSFYPLAGRVLSECCFQQGQKLAWTRAIALTMVQVYDWGADEPNAAEGMSLARAFAQAEDRFLPCCYAPDALCEDGLYVLPPMHRFGWWCAKAFGALDAGDAVGYTRSLRKGLSTCGAMKPMVEFLMRHTPELQTPPPSAELLALAQQIKTVLAGFAPDDPTVAALKQSEAYRKVAYLIEAKDMGGKIGPRKMTTQKFVGFLESYNQMSKMLKTYNYQEILKQASTLAEIDPTKFEQYPMGGYSKGMTSGAYRFVLKDLLEHIEEYDWLYNRFEDDISREVFTNLIRYRLFPANSFLVAAYDAEHPHYYDKTIVKCNEDEVFVDCGAFDGDSTEKFIKYYGTYKHIYAYEPSAENIQACQDNLKKYDNVTVRQCGVGEKEAFLSMDSNGASSTFMRERQTSAGDGIQIISLDEDILEKITYCKMDIEGFEIPALLGAKRHIQNDFPKLAISLYHIVTDIWEIPRLIDSIHPGYRFFIRHYDPKHNWETVLYAIPPEKE